MSPPQTVMIQINETDYSPSGSFSSDGVLVWRISEDDPDQINGSYTYSLYRNTTEPGATQCNAATGTANRCGWTRGNQSGTPIPGRTGWLKVPLSIAFSAGSAYCNVGDNELDCAFNMTAWSGGLESEPSCLVNVTLDQAGSHRQCGAFYPEAPAGIGATVRSVANETVNGLVQVKWPTSSNESDRNVGNMTYTLLAFATDTSGTAREILNSIDPRNTNLDGAGSRIYNLSTGDVGSYSVSFIALVQDPLTLMRSNGTCPATVDIGIQYTTSYCGDVTSFDITQAPPSISELPLFPLVNVPSLGNKLGFDLDQSKLFFAILLIGLVTGLGYWVARGWGIMGGFAIGFGGSGILGLIPLWVVILGFLAGLGVVLLLLRSGGGEA